MSDSDPLPSDVGETSIGGSPSPESDWSRSERGDAALLAAVARGESEAFGELYDSHNRLAFIVAHRILNDWDASEDVVQSAFFSLWRWAGTGNAECGSVRSWLMTITRDAAIARRRGQCESTGEDGSRADFVRRLVTDGKEPSVTLSRPIDSERVVKAVVMLPPDQREALEMAYSDGLTYLDIAERTGAAAGAIKERLRLGLHGLRLSLTDLAPGSAAAPSETSR